MAERIEIKEAIRLIAEGGALSSDDAAAVMDQIMTGAVTPAQIGALVTALRMRGETEEEIAGFAAAMRRHALHVDVDLDDGPLVDTCGTGGDSSGTFNISTTAAFVIAGAGVRVAKHGNRSMTSKCGSADLLEGVGVAIDLTPEDVATCVNEVGIGFMYAPSFHPAMRFVGPTRREIGIRTVFNILGPLTNPAGARHQLIGVGHPNIAGKLANALARLGSQRVVLVHAEEGLDELGLAGASQVTEYDAERGEVRTYTVAPEDVDLAAAPRGALAGGEVADNVKTTLGILSGEMGPRRDATLLNAGAGIYAAGAAESMAEGVRQARAAIDSGAAMARLEHLIARSQALAAGADAMKAVAR
ncbi:MAG: anthranilate phosphoribosyltransferase [Thermomicrobiales bacterium]|nr:anthranilate phosphoribosyltransferase [Thermomicrobiales bacterium]